MSAFMWAHIIIQHRYTHNHIIIAISARQSPLTRNSLRSLSLASGYDPGRHVMSTVAVVWRLARGEIGITRGDAQIDVMRQAPCEECERRC
jgi:hypothetical protein